MVSERCKLIVTSMLKALGIKHFKVELGEVHLEKKLPAKEHESLKVGLTKYGLELVNDKKKILVEKIKKVIIEMIHYSDDRPKTNNSEYLSKKLHYDYTYLANVFSEIQGTTIEQFIIAHKIERVKELLAYNELSLTEIAHKMHYSTVSHLSNQFKKVTGVSPTRFKKSEDKKRIALENISAA